MYLVVHAKTFALPEVVTDTRIRDARVPAIAGIPALRFFRPKFRLLLFSPYISGRTLFLDTFPLIFPIVHYSKQNTTKNQQRKNDPPKIDPLRCYFVFLHVVFAAVVQWFAKVLCVYVKVLRV